ncbi:MAG: hypothetical protein J0I43_10845 [Microbacterium sp.]|uniref:AfsA-related hotdog domain-containing protein n=1 Tax=Microbacterium sp. TaxID=51671 RepID=UPI001AC57305|nr:AfsA-related hotdog domain-containing protein [Microbacterium sp.]MBN9177852.1 hypothetical protein [Microbacterium sp.]
MTSTPLSTNRTVPITPTPMATWIDVPQAAIHKRSLSEILVTRFRREEDLCRFVVRILRRHTMWSAERDELPLIIAVEALRQVGLALGHLGGNVPLEWAFILNETSFSWTTSAPVWTGGDDLTLEVSCNVESSREHHGVLVELVAKTDFWLGDQLIGTGHGHINCLPPRAYRLIRRAAVATSNAAMAPGTALLHDRSNDDVQLRATLGWEYPHPFFYDHDADHVPGMLLAEAAIAAHMALNGVQPGSISLVCSKFAEFGSDVSLLTNKGALTSTEFTQSGAPIARARTGSPMGRGGSPVIAR